MGNKLSNILGNQVVKESVKHESANIFRVSEIRRLD